MRSPSHGSSARRRPSGRGSRGVGGRCGLVLQLLLPLRCGGLYDPTHHEASARIYGNVDAFAYYYIDLLVGTPPQRVSVIVDTGSGVTAFPCKSCRHCGSHMDPAFDFPRSKSAKWLPCGKGCRGTCRDGRHCGYYQGYTEGSSITGWWFRDAVKLGDAIQQNPAVQLSMGCHQDETNLFYTQKANGILGMHPPGRGTPTLLQQLFADKKHIDSNVFSLCLAEWGGRIVVGGFNKSYHLGPVSYIPLVTSAGHYGVHLTSMRVNGQEVSSQFGSTMLDSGTTYVYMASQPYHALRSAIESYCERHDGCNAEHQGTCWEVRDRKVAVGRFPTVGVVFGTLQTAWVPSTYMYRKGSTSRWCYAFEDDGPYANTVLGATWMINQEVVFDLRRKRVGIAKAKCPEFRKRPKFNARQELAVVTDGPGSTSSRATQAGEGATGLEAEDLPAGALQVGAPQDRGLGLVLTALGGVAAVLTSAAVGGWAVQTCQRKEFVADKKAEVCSQMQCVPMDSSLQDPLVVAARGEF